MHTAEDKRLQIFNVTDVKLPTLNKTDLIKESLLSFIKAVTKFIPEWDEID